MLLEIGTKRPDESGGRSAVSLKHSKVREAWVLLSFNRPFPNPNSGEFQGMERRFSFVTPKECWGFPGGSAVKNRPANAGNIGSGRSPGEGNGNPLQYSCLENPMDRGAWRATVHGVAESWTQLSD